MPKLISGAEIVFKALEDQNVEFIFGYPGGACLLYTSPSPRDATLSRMPSSA